MEKGSIIQDQYVNEDSDSSIDDMRYVSFSSED